MGTAWTSGYRDLIDRNIGIITQERQERLRRAKAAVFGMGGIGGTAFEVLVRCGIGRFSIVDCDVFEASNMNRQVFAYRHTLGRRKIDVAAEMARSINPDVSVERFDRVDAGNIDSILHDADVAAMGIDSLAPCVIASRSARGMDIPLVEAWALPYGNVRVFTADTPTLEETYGLPTQDRALGDISDEEFRELGRELMANLTRMDGVKDYFPPEVTEAIRQGRVSSFAPIVWLSGVLLALECVKALLNWGTLALAPSFSLYDPFLHRSPQ